MFGKGLFVYITIWRWLESMCVFRSGCGFHLAIQQKFLERFRCPKQLQVMFGLNVFKKKTINNHMKPDINSLVPQKTCEVSVGSKFSEDMARGNNSQSPSGGGDFFGMRERDRETGQNASTYNANGLTMLWLSLSRWWFQTFYFHPENRGRFPFWRAYFSDGLKPPTSCVLGKEEKTWEGKLMSQA